MTAMRRQGKVGEGEGKEMRQKERKDGANERGEIFNEGCKGVRERD